MIQANKFNKASVTVKAKSMNHSKNSSSVKSEKSVDVTLNSRPVTKCQAKGIVLANSYKPPSGATY